MNMIITNLFSIFDPSTSIRMSINWISIFLWLLFIPLTIWVLPNRVIIIFKGIINYIFNEFKPLINKNPQILIVSVRIFTLIIINNVPGLFPFIFTATRHISINLVLALPLWLGLIIHGWRFNTRNLLIHLIPNSTPFILIPFIVIIETIRNIIRPITLAIRLTANIIAGHLLISLLIRASSLTPLIIIPILFRAQTALITLEIAVAFIQAYVFSVLITLYTAERIQ